MPAHTTSSISSVLVTLPIWHYARQIVTGTADVPVLDKSGSPLPSGTKIIFQGISDNGTGDARVKFNPSDLAANAVIVSGASATAGRAVFVFKYRLPS